MMMTKINLNMLSVAVVLQSALLSMSTKTVVAQTPTPTVPESDMPTGPSDFPSSIPSESTMEPTMTMAPTIGPTTSMEPTASNIPTMFTMPPSTGSDAVFSNQEAQCSAYMKCQALDLEGDCCPTVDDWTLECCGPTVAETCTLNPQCQEFNLTGTCCPTTEGWYLDCCESVPDECGYGECELVAAVDYLMIQEGDVDKTVASSAVSVVMGASSKVLIASFGGITMLVAGVL